MLAEEGEEDEREDVRRQVVVKEEGSVGEEVREVVEEVPPTRHLPHPHKLTPLRCKYKSNCHWLNVHPYNILVLLTYISNRHYLEIATSETHQM